MRVLVLSRDLSGASLCHRLAREGHEVRVSVSDPLYADALEGIVGKAPSPEAGIAWVGKDGLVVADDVGFGGLQDKLRAQGYSVVGGSAGGDRLEEDRPWCQRVLADCGIPSLPTLHFATTADAVAHVRAHACPWVVKQNGHPESIFCYVGRLADGSDVIGLLQHYARVYGDAGGFVLQQRVSGVEISVVRCFNGRSWVGPIGITVEHKKLCAGDVGPKTPEMGTLMWYDADEGNRLFQETLARLEPYLRQVDFRGNVDINCIVNETGVFPLEVTARFGYPAFQLQTEFHVSPWGEFLKAVADGRDYALEWRRGYGLVALVATPPFPYFSPAGRKDLSPRGLKLGFHHSPTDADWNHLHPEEVARRVNGNGEPEYFVAGDTGYVLHVSALGEDIETARAQLYARLGNIVVPRMFYRTDLGTRFIEQDRVLLERWGWL